MQARGRGDPSSLCTSSTLVGRADLGIARLMRCILVRYPIRRRVGMVSEGYQMLALRCKYIEPSEMQYLIGRHHVYFVFFEPCLNIHRPSSL